MNFFISLDVLRWRLEELASLEEQKRLWLGASLREMSTFEEACCGVFDDAGVRRAIENGFMLDRYGSEIVSGGAVQDGRRLHAGVPGTDQLVDMAANAKQAAGLKA